MSGVIFNYMLSLFIIHPTPYGISALQRLSDLVIGEEFAAFALMISNGCRIFEPFARRNP